MKTTIEVISCDHCGSRTPELCIVHIKFKIPYKITHHKTMAYRTIEELDFCDYTCMLEFFNGYEYELLEHLSIED